MQQLTIKKKCKHLSEKWWKIISPPKIISNIPLYNRFLQVFFPLQQPEFHIILSHWKDKVKTQLLPCESREKMFSLFPISCLESRVMPEGSATGLFHQTSQTKEGRKTLGQEGRRHFLGKLRCNQRVEELTHKEHLSSSPHKREKCCKLRYRLEDNQLESGVIMGSVFVLGWSFFTTRQYKQHYPGTRDRRKGVSRTKNNTCR